MIRWLRGSPTGWQITLVHALILTIVLGGIGEAVLAQQRRDLVHVAEAQLLGDLRREVSGLPEMPNAADAGKDQTQPANDKLTFFLNGLPDSLASGTPGATGAAVFHPDGSVMATSSGTAPPSVPRAAFTTAAASGAATFTATIAGAWTAAALVPLRTGGALVGFAEASASLAPVEREIGRLRAAFIIGWVGAVALSTLLTASVTRQVLRPLQRLIQVTRRVGEGDLTQRAGLTPSRNELAQLGAAFDMMVAQLEQAFAAQRRFVADAAHELRTPLTALSASTELLLMGADEADPVTMQRLLRTLDRELNRLIRLTNDLLTLSAVDAGAPMTLQPTDLSALIGEIGECHRERFADYDFHLEIAPSLWANANADRFCQVLLNLLDNARKYTPSGGAITLSAVAQDALIQVTVEDAGIGFPADALAMVFQRFHRIDSARARQNGGAGLGLAIVHALVQAHGGQVSVDSKPGEGTRVRISLPRAPA